MRERIFVVIPAYNEERMISAVLDRLCRQHAYKIVVVDDGSSDATIQQASKYPVCVLSHLINRGQGAALKTGIDYALMQDADIIVTFDADGQHRVEDIQSLLKPIHDGSADVALGSRFLSARSTEEIPAVRRAFLKVGAYILYIMYGIRLTDSHNGLRAFSRAAAQAMDLKADRMDHASEIPEQIKKNKLRYVEVSVHIDYTEYSLQHGQNSLNAFSILYKMIVKKLLR